MNDQRQPVQVAKPQQLAPALFPVFIMRVDRIFHVGWVRRLDKVYQKI
jgi:hypothetical protein